MDGSDKVLSSSTSTKPSQIPKDENDQSYQEMGLNLQNPKKPTTKNYMSPTVSAASKATPPRKKILAEINQSFDTHLQKTQNLDSKPTQKNPNLETSNESLSQNIPLSSQGTESDGNDQNNKPYDPVMNYLSPRPKFLRYKPNRSREVSLLRENERKEGNDGLSRTSAPFDSKKDNDEEVALVSAQGTLVCSSLEGYVKGEDEDFDESDDEFEEVEEKRGWGLRGVLKFLLVLVVLILTTSYISSMNSPTPSFSVQAVEGLKDRCHMIQYHVHEFVKSFENGSQFLNGKEGTQMGSMELNHTIVDEGIEGEEENSDDLSEMVELQSGESEGVEMVEGEKKGEVDELSEVVELQSGEKEAVEVVEGEKKGEAVELSEVVEPQAAEMDDVCDNEMAKSGEFVDQMTENVDSLETETVEKFESLPDSQALIISDGVDYPDVLSNVSNALEKENEIIMEPVEEVYNEEPRDKDQVDSEMNGTENITTDYLKVVIWASMIVASLVLGFRVMKKKNVRKYSSTVIKLCTESVIAEKSKSVLTNEEKRSVINGSSMVIEPYTQSVKAGKSSSMLHNVDKEHIKCADSFAKSMSLTNPMDEDLKESYQIRAPSVEFLGEFEVGGVGSTLRSSGMKSRMVESEVGSHSVSLEKGYGSKAYSMPNRAQPAFSEFSTMVSPSYGSFSAEKQILKKQKQESGDGDGKKVVITPVRRSSRLRNRAVISP